MVAPVGPLAIQSREPGQARKGAAVAVAVCAGVWLAGATSRVRSENLPMLMMREAEIRRNAHNKAVDSE